MNSTSLGIRLSEFTALIKQTLDDRFAGQTFWVIAEISSLNHHARSNMYYFHLIEKEEHSGQIKAEISAVAFSQLANAIQEFEQQTGQQFQNGIQVLLNVSVSYHPVYGLKVSMLKIDASFTIGQLQKQREATLAKLLVENPDSVQFVNGQYHTRNQGLKIPLVIQRVAVISSETSAGLQDFKHTVEENSYGYKISVQLFQTAVQGDEQGKQLVEKLIEVFRAPQAFDIVVIVRGGGAQTDFLMFDAYPVARAIARFPIPVLTGLGHLKDISIADLMAHTALKTPTKVAEFIIAHNRQFEERILQIRQQIIIKTQQRLTFEKEILASKINEIQTSFRILLQTQSEELQSIKHKLLIQSQGVLNKNSDSLNELSQKLSLRPATIISNAQNNFENKKLEFEQIVLRRIKNQENKLQHFTSLFRALSPANTLKRGFAIVIKDGVIQTDARQIKKDDSIQVYLGESELDVSVIKKQKKYGKQFNL